MEKSYNHMKKGIFLILLLLIPMVSAEIEYFQNKLFITGESIFNYITIRNSGFLAYDKTDNDYIKKNNPLEVFVEFRTYLQRWNNSTDTLDVDYCNLLILYLPAHSNDNTVEYNRTFYPNDTDISSDQFFIKLQDKDAMRVQADCHFVNPQSLNPVVDLDMPLDFSFNTPTWECKACQFYEWEQRIRDVEKAELLGGNTGTVLSFIQRLVVINFEIISILFWVFLVLVLYMALGLFFSVIYWGYSYLRKVIV